MEPHLVILAGGISSRMRKPGSPDLDPALSREADEKPKAMIGVGADRRPFLDYLLANVSGAGYRDVVIVVGESDRSIRARYGESDRGNSFLDLSISYATQPLPPGQAKPLGTADALLHGLRARPDWAGTKVTVCNSDNLYSVEALRTLREAPEPCALIDYDRGALQFAEERVDQFAVIQKDGEGYVRAILEKPGPGVMSRLAGPRGRVGVSMNIYRLSYDLILPYLVRVPAHPVRGEKELPTAVMMLALDFPRAVKAYERAELVPDLTRKGDIHQVQEQLRHLVEGKGQWPR